MNKGKAITVRFTPDEMLQLEKYAAKDNRPVANFIYHVVIRHVQKLEKENNENA